MKLREQVTGNGSMVINPSLFETLTYDPQRDLAPVSLLVSWPKILAVGSDIPAKTVKELAALAKSKPDELTYGHSGVGISQHLASEQLKQMGGRAIRPVA